MYEEYLQRIEPHFCLLHTEDCENSVFFEDKSITLQMDTANGEYVSYVVEAESIYEDQVKVLKNVHVDYQGHNEYEIKGDRDIVRFTVRATFHAYNPDTDRVDITYPYVEVIEMERDCCQIERMAFCDEVKSWIVKESNAIRQRERIGKKKVHNEWTVQALSNIIWYLDQCGVTCDHLRSMKCLFNKVKNACICA